MEQNKFSWCVPKELGIPADSLRLRVDFFHQSTTLTSLRGDTGRDEQPGRSDAMGHLSQHYRRELAVGTGLLPENTPLVADSRDGTGICDLC